jgi:RNA polymerase sigma-70 factor (ECF subfamily)
MTATVEKIWQELASELRGFIRARVRNHAAAEDILQDVFVKIHHKLPTLRAGERLEAWVWRITRNAITDHFRRTRPSEPMSEDFSTDSASEVELPDLSPCVRRFVGELPPTYRDSLIFTEWQGMTQDELARKLGLSVSGAKSRVQRARSQLKELLLDCCRFAIDRRGNVIDYTSRAKSDRSDCLRCSCDAVSNRELSPREQKDDSNSDEA